MAEIKKGDKFIASGDFAKPYEVKKISGDDVTLVQTKAVPPVPVTGQPEKQEIVVSKDTLIGSDSWAGVDDSDAE